MDPRRAVASSAEVRVGAFRSALGVLTCLFAFAAGVALWRRSDTLFGAVWASLFLVVGLVILITYALAWTSPHGAAPPARDVEWDGEPARFLARRDPHRAGYLSIIVLLGGWFLTMGVVGAVEETWLWLVLAVVPAGYFLGFPVLAALGRFRPGGVWLTPTRVVNEQYGVRTEVALTDVDTAIPRSHDIRVVPTDVAAVAHRRLAPRWWCARVREEMVVATDGLATDGEALAAEVRERAAAARAR